MADPDNPLRSKILAINNDNTLSDAEKAKKRQELMCGKWLAPSSPSAASPGGSRGEAVAKGQSTAEAEQSTILDDTLKCAFCFELCVRPVTAPCQHNFCLSCFSRWVAKGKSSCPTCRAGFPAKFAANPRINTALAGAIRLAKQGVRPAAARAESERIANANRPEEAFRTERAQRAGMANASSGRIMVTCAGDHFGPILAEHDPERGLGVQVGEFWRDRLHCRQWGAHFPHVAGIAGQSGRGAQSVVLSGGYEDDKDEGEWFLYTGSGGRDLSGNKRTNKEQSKDQTFTCMNEALKVSCQQGLPVRVVRSYKEKRSSYAPKEDEAPVRYDGIYRIRSCWRSKGAQGYLVCRYLFIRCDNDPAPWSSEDTGDRPTLDMPEAALKERKKAVNQVDMEDQPSWDWNAEAEQWGWTRDPPPSQRAGERDPNDPKTRKRKVSEAERALSQFTCGVCKQLPTQPVSTPCGHHFCKPCLVKRFPEPVPSTAAAGGDGRGMRVRKVPKACPTCKADIADFLRTAQENREMADVIARLQRAAREARVSAGIDEPEDGGSEGCTLVESATQPASASALGSQPPAGEEQTQQTAAAPATDAQVLAAEFPDIDAGLIEAMLEDQGGDAADVRFALRRIQKDDGKAKAAAEKAARTAAKAAAAQATTVAATDTAAAESDRIRPPSRPVSKEEATAQQAACADMAPAPLAVPRRCKGSKAAAAVLVAAVAVAHASSESDDTEFQPEREKPAAAAACGAAKCSAAAGSEVGESTRAAKRARK